MQCFVPLWEYYVFLFFALIVLTRSVNAEPANFKRDLIGKIPFKLLMVSRRNNNYSCVLKDRAGITHHLLQISMYYDTRLIWNYIQEIYYVVEVMIDRDESSIDDRSN